MKKLKLIIKKILPVSIFDKIYNFYLILVNPRKEIPNYVLNKKYFVKNDDKKNIFSLRMMGGATLGRAQTFYTKEPDTVEWIKNFKKNSVFFDIGANVGIYSLFAAKLSHKVLSFEPESHNFLALNLNINDNNLEEKVIAYPISIDQSMKISTLNIFKFRFGGSGHSFGRPITSDGKQFKPSSHTQGSISITLDKFCEEVKIYPEFVKIDVDGNELRVLKGMINLLSTKKIKSLLIELNQDFEEHKEVINILSNYNYKIQKKLFNTSNYIFNIN